MEREKDLAYYNKRHNFFWCSGILLLILDVILIIIMPEMDRPSKFLFDVFVVLFIACISCYIASWHYKKKIEVIEDIEKQKEEEIEIEREQYFIDSLKKCVNDFIEKSVDLYLGFDNSSFYLIDDDCIASLKKTNELKAFEKALKYKAAIKVNDIIFFSKEGDVQYTTAISGGGGGGSSIGGAIIGAVIAGGVGAVIGSRKKVEEIHSTVEEHDNRITVIRYKNNGKIEEISIDGVLAYDFLLKHIPEKDLLNIQLEVNKSSNGASAEERLVKLKSLYEKELINKDEYEKMRSEVLESL